MQSLKGPSFFLTNSIGSSQGDMLMRMYPLSRSSYNYILSYVSSSIFIHYGDFYTGNVQRTNSIVKTIFRFGGQSRHVLRKYISKVLDY